MRIEKIGNATLYLADCADVLSQLGGVDAVITDPPYGLNFMGKKWDHDVPNVDVWAGCLSALKPGGHLLAFAGTRTQHRMAVRIEDAGFEIRDMIAWIYGSGMPKSHNLRGDMEGWGTALKPSIEPITVARKSLIGTVASNVLSHGTGALNIDGCRVPAELMRPNTGSGGLPRRNVDEQRGPGVVAQPHKEGRWPANLIHDGSDEVLALFPNSKGQQGDIKGAEISRTGGEGTNCYGKYAARIPNFKRGDAGSAARFFYCAKASKLDRDEGLEGAPDRILAMSDQAQKELARGNMYRGNGGMNIAKVRKNNHPTVKPTDLMAYLIRLVTPPGGVVLDPFMGSGSTGKAAMRDGFRFIGIERDPQYFDIACERILQATKQASLFEPATNSEPRQEVLI